MTVIYISKQMKKNQIDYVNVFQGSGKIDLPDPKGIAKKWLFIKARCGNTHPGAAYPFGKMTILPYTGGYPIGYGNHRPNTCGDPTTFDARVHGFSHIHASGTGGIRAHYNYALTSPVKTLGRLNENLVDEAAVPGYYSARLSNGTLFEGTVTKNIALHRYSLTDEKYLQIDFSNFGLLRDFGHRGNPNEGCDPAAEVKILSENLVCASVVFYGIRLYFAAECKNALDVFLWKDYNAVEGDLISANGGTFGAAFSVKSKADLRVSVSFVSLDNAVRMLREDPCDFDVVKASAYKAWESALSKIFIETEDETLKEIFYSNLYHSLIKPCSGCGESFIDGTDNVKSCFDLATLWDLYKTPLPLIFSLYPEISEEIVETILRFAEKEGHSFINLTIAKDNDFPDQARMLAEHILFDYYIRGGEKYADRILALADADMAHYSDFKETGFCERYTHILDSAEGFGAMAELAEKVGDTERAEKYKQLSKNWINAFDKETGLLSENSRYYEGDLYNYSFRLLRNMDERVAIKGKEKFVSDLDHFFGYSRDDVVQSTEPEFNPLTLEIHSFEGFNNESDIETPFAYSYVGEHNKTCEIMRAGMKYMFTTGEGGLPGNNDSGGLSSLYVWSVLGLFPVSGQNLMFIGSPAADGGTFHLSNGKNFRVKVYGNSDENIYVKRAVLNGVELPDFRFTVTEMLQGGLLELYMSEN